MSESIYESVFVNPFIYKVYFIMELMAVTKPPYRPSPFQVYLHSDSGRRSIKSVTLGYAALLTGMNSLQREITTVKYRLIGSITAVGTADGQAESCLVQGKQLPALSLAAAAKSCQTRNVPYSSSFDRFITGVLTACSAALLMHTHEFAGLQRGCARKGSVVHWTPCCA